ncbi:MAG: hypothetical protein ABI635_07145 [Actinomycetota bacterium]
MSRTVAPNALVWAPLRALARVEGGKLARHPVFLMGVGFVLVGSGLFVRATMTDQGATWDDDGWPVSAGLILLAILTMVAANLASLRDRREDTTEQHATLPVERSTRTGALIAATVWPAGAAALLLAGVAGYAATREAMTGLEQVHLAERLVAVVMLGALGVALAVWLPSPFVAVVVAWGLLFVSPGEYPQTWHVLTPFAGLTDPGLALWHLAYLMGLAIVFGVVALVRTSRGPSLIVAGIVGTAIVIVSAAILIPGGCPALGRCLF